MNTSDAGPGFAATRPMSASDMEQVRRLLDDAMGSGFWYLDVNTLGSHRVAVADGRVVGVASACITPDAPEFDEVPGPVCTVRLVAVDPRFRDRGIATVLVREVCEECEALGTASFQAFAWVHAATGDVPAAGVLGRLGFERLRRIEAFYAGATSDACPGCGAIPCVCPADVYVRTASWLTGPGEVGDRVTEAEQE